MKFEIIPAQKGARKFAIQPGQSVKGYNGSITVHDHSITIHRQGLSNKLLGLHGDKEISIKSITAVQLKAPGMLTNGFIQFVFSGSSESKGGTFDAIKDENSVVFTKKELPYFEAIRDFVNERRNAAHNPPTFSAPPADDVYSQLEKLADLRDKGIITASDFEMKKNQLLGI